MKNEYIIVNKTAIQKRIEELEATDTASWEYQLGQINALKQVLSQSTPLIPEIEKAFFNGGDMKEEEEFHFYISNLKLDI